MAELKVAVLISGRGTNLQALIDACAADDYPARIVLVVSNQPGAKGLERARAAEIASTVIEHHDYPSREAFDAALAEAIGESGADLGCLAGFMRVVADEFVRQWRDRLIHIHPSLRPAFPGLNTHARALDAGVRFSGCTVHFARTELDAGPIIVQAVVPVVPGDTPDSLADRVLEAEHRIYPMALRLLAEGRVRVTSETVQISGAAAPDTTLISPLELEA